MAYTGRCLCGAVTLEFSAEPIATVQCWCSQCQKIASGSSSNNAIFKGEDVILSGALATATWTAASGNTLECFFCPSCGTHVYGRNSGRLHLSAVRLGVIDEPHGLKPEKIVWTGEAPAWAVLDPTLEQWPQQTPPPKPKA